MNTTENIQRMVGRVVRFDFVNMDDCLLTGTVLSTPCELSNGAWEIECADGEIMFVQNYQTMIVLDTQGGLAATMDLVKTIDAYHDGLNKT